VLNRFFFVTDIVIKYKLDQLSIFDLLGLIYPSNFVVYPIWLYAVVFLANIGLGSKWLSWTCTLVYFSAVGSDKEKRVL
jgi:hypothetical protein